MGIHLGLRDLCGSHVKAQPGVFLSESGLSTAFGCVGESQEEQETWRSMRVLAEQLAELHQQEQGVNKELDEAQRRLSYLSDACKLLAELSAYAPSVLGQQAADVPAADAAHWLKWWKDPRSWSAGYTFQQWLQDHSAAGGSACSPAATATTGRAAGPRAPRLTGPRPANVTQAVLWRLQGQGITPQACQAAGAVVSALQARLADIQQQQEHAFAQLSEGWRALLQSAFTPQQQEPLVLQLTISPDGPALQELQQQLVDSQAQLLAALQDVAAARQRAEAAEAALQQQLKPQKQAGLQQQQQPQKQEAPPLQQGVKLPPAAACAAHGKGSSSTAEQPDTPAFRGLNDQQHVPAPPALVSDTSPCSSSGSSNPHRTSSRVTVRSPGHPQDSGGSDSHSRDDQQQPQLPPQQQAATMWEAGACTSAAAPDKSHRHDQQAPPAAVLAGQECSGKAWGQGGSMCTRGSCSTPAAAPPPAAAGLTGDPTTEQAPASVTPEQQHGREPLLQEPQAGVSAEGLTPLIRQGSCESVCNSAHSRCSHSSDSVAAVVGSTDLFTPAAAESVRGKAGINSRGCSSGIGGGPAAALAAPAAAAVPARCPSFFDTLAARLSQRARPAAPTPASAPEAAEADEDAATAVAAVGGAAVVRQHAAAPVATSASASAASADSAGAAACDWADVSNGSGSTISGSVRMAVIGPLSPEKVLRGA